MSNNDDNSSSHTRILFMSTKSLSEIGDILVQKNITIKISDLRSHELMKLFHYDKSEDFIKIYNLFEDKHKFSDIVINDESVVSYMVRSKKVNILNEILHDITNYRSTSSEIWIEGSNIMHIICWYHYYDLIIKLHGINKELILMPNSYGLTPFDLFIIAFYNNSRDFANVIENQKIIDMIDPETYQLLLKNKSTSVYKQNNISFKEGSNFVDILDQIILSGNDSAKFKNMNTQICDAMFAKN